MKFTIQTSQTARPVPGESTSVDGFYDDIAMLMRLSHLRAVTYSQKVCVTSDFLKYLHLLPLLISDIYVQGVKELSNEHLKWVDYFVVLAKVNKMNFKISCVQNTPTMCDLYVGEAGAFLNAPTTAMIATKSQDSWMLSNIFPHEVDVKNADNWAGLVVPPGFEEWIKDYSLPFYLMESIRLKSNSIYTALLNQAVRKAILTKPLRPLPYHEAASFAIPAGVAMMTRYKYSCDNLEIHPSIKRKLCGSGTTHLTNGYVELVGKGRNAAYFAMRFLNGENDFPESHLMRFVLNVYNYVISIAGISVPNECIHVEEAYIYTLYALFTGDFQSLGCVFSELDSKKTKLRGSLLYKKSGTSSTPVLAFKGDMMEVNFGQDQQPKVPKDKNQKNQKTQNNSVVAVDAAPDKGNQQKQKAPPKQNPNPPKNNSANAKKGGQDGKQVQNRPGSKSPQKGRKAGKSRSPPRKNLTIKDRLQVSKGVVTDQLDKERGRTRSNRRSKSRNGRSASRSKSTGRGKSKGRGQSRGRGNGGNNSQSGSTQN